MQDTRNTMDALDVQARYWAAQFIDAAAEYVHGLEFRRLCASTVKKRFISLFGVTPRHCALIWTHTQEKTWNIDNGRKEIHLLWTLNLLKCDDTENVLHSRWKADEKTIRKWTRIFLVVISNLEVVSKVIYMHYHYNEKTKLTTLSPSPTDRLVLSKR